MPTYTEGQLFEAAAGELVPIQKTVTFDGVTDGKGALAATAVLTTALTGANNDLDFTAVATDATGNKVTITYINPGVDSGSLLVRVNGNDIAVWLATGVLTAATGTLTDGNSTDVSDGATCVIGVTTYRFKSTMAQIGDIQIGASADATLLSLAKTLSGTGVAGTDMFTGTPADPAVTSSTSVVSHAITLTARTKGTVGNSIVLTGATHLTASGAALTGGVNTDTITTVSGDIITAIAAETTAAALVVATNHSGNNGTGVVTAMAKSSLIGGITGLIPLFKVTGTVLVSLRGYCLATLTGTSATLVHGNAFATNRLITILTATNITVRKGIDSTGVVADGTALAKTPLKIFLDGETIYATPATAAVTGGTIDYLCDYIPLTVGAFVATNP